MPDRSPRPPPRGGWLMVWAGAFVYVYLLLYGVLYSLCLLLIVREYEQQQNEK